MYSKEELLAKNTSELEDIARQLGMEPDQNAPKEKVVYDILDKQAYDSSHANATATATGTSSAAAAAARWKPRPREQALS